MFFFCYRYRRIFSFGTSGVSTYDPENLEITNRWPYSDVISLKPNPGECKFSITVKKDRTRRVETMMFSTEHRSELLNYGFQYRHLFADYICDNLVSNVYLIPNMN